jgi:hypothetical protein
LSDLGFTPRGGQLKPCAPVTQRGGVAKAKLPAPGVGELTALLACRRLHLQAPPTRPAHHLRLHRRPGLGRVPGLTRDARAVPDSTLSTWQRTAPAAAHLNYPGLRGDTPPPAPATSRLALISSPTHPGAAIAGAAGVGLLRGRWQTFIQLRMPRPEAGVVSQTGPAAGGAAGLDSWSAG